MSDAYDPAGTPVQPRAKRGCRGRVFLILAIITAICFVLCCGAGVWIFSVIQGSIKEKPDEVIAVQNKIVDIDIPDEMRPAGGMDLDFFGLFDVQVAVFGDQVVQPNQQGEQQGSFKGKFLMLLQMQVYGQSPDELETGLQQRSDDQGVDIEIQSREMKTVEIDGQQVDFEFAQGTNREDNAQVRMVTGVFPGRGGTTMLILVVPEEEWNEEEAMTLLQSIQR